MPSAADAGTITIGGDLTVNRLGFGAMRITGGDGGVWGYPPDPDAARALLRRVVELDVTFIDTADSYGPDVSERLIGEALAPYPEGVVVATKGGFLRDGPGSWRPDGRPEHLRGACEGSLARLGLERIDVYQLHTPDPAVPIEDSLGALADLRREGKIRHVGVSNVDVDELERARSVVDVVSVQNRYSLSDREHEDVLDACERLEIAFIPWYPLARGRLAAEESLERIAGEKSATPAQISLAWLLRRSPVMLPIPGTSSEAHLEENVSAAALELTDGELQELAELGVA